MMRIKNEKQRIEKPKNWPANQREAKLSVIYENIEKFINKPDYKLKEILISLVSQIDLNESDNIGLHRITEYEVLIINSLYLYATKLCFYSLKIYLYKRIAETACLQKMAYQFKANNGVTLEIKEYRYLISYLKLFYITYLNFNLEKSRNFSKQLIKEINLLKVNANEVEINHLTCDYITLINDLSYFHSVKTFEILKWDKNELLEIFSLGAELIEKSKQDPTKRPLRGVLFTTISNWVLKSRNNYNEDYIYKFMSDEASEKALNNEEIWMQNIEYLNDKREQKVIREIYKNKTWIKYNWAKKINLDSTRIYYVSSFSKNYPNEKMNKEYGKNIFGYKTDRIADVLLPIHLTEKGKPIFGQVICFDIIYSQEDAKKELNYLCDIINLFKINDILKNNLLNEIIQYWILSFKDKKWEYEKERRYVLFIYSGYQYKDINIDNRFFKLKSTIYMYPDFILKNENNYYKIRAYRKEKLNAISTKPYLFCDNCLQNDYDIIYESYKTETCPICGSKRIYLIDKNKYLADK